MQSSFAHLLAALFVSSAAFTPSSQATLLNANDVGIGSAVVFETDFGDITVGLFDSTTPQTVANFLNYVEGTTANGGSYNPGFFHRFCQFMRVDKAPGLFQRTWVTFQHEKCSPRTEPGQTQGKRQHYQRHSHDDNRRP